MVDHIEFSVPPGTQIATDKIGSVDHPYGKIEDGRPGGTQALTVTDHEGLLAESALAGGLGTSAIGQTSYLDGELVGGAITLGTFGGGLYRVDRLITVLANVDVSAFASDALPSVHVAFYAVPAGTDVSALADGADLSSVLPTDLLGLHVVPDADLAPIPVLSVPAVVGTPDMPLVMNALGPLYSEATDLYALLIADGPIITDLTAWTLVVNFHMSFQGDASRI